MGAKKKEKATRIGAVGPGSSKLPNNRGICQRIWYFPGVFTKAGGLSGCQRQKSYPLTAPALRGYLISKRLPGGMPPDLRQTRVLLHCYRQAKRRIRVLNQRPFQERIAGARPAH